MLSPRPRKRTRLGNLPSRLDSTSSHHGAQASPGNDASPQSLTSQRSAASAASPDDAGTLLLPPPPASSSSFRNVSACNRCRLRKNRCDQNLPSCLACQKAGARCVGFDPLTKREMPRSYVHFLESRTSYLESLLQEHGLPFAPAHDFVTSDHQSASALPPGLDLRETGNAAAVPSDWRPDDQVPLPESREPHGPLEQADPSRISARGVSGQQRAPTSVTRAQSPESQLASEPSRNAPGVTFAQLVLSTVKSTVSSKSWHSSDQAGAAAAGKAARSAPGAAAMAGGTTMRDAFTSLHVASHFRPAPFPDRHVALKLANLYFEHANPQIPILHRGEFMQLLAAVYSKGHIRTSRELYIVNIVFAIGAGVILTASSSRRASDTSAENNASAEEYKPFPKEYQPEEYHAAAIVHLEPYLGSSRASGRDFGGRLEKLQAILLLAGLALLRPVAPGLWYIAGVAVRLAVDLGLHYEDGVPIGDEDEPVTDGVLKDPPQQVGDRELKRREWTRDLRRRLWWCCYSFDRLVSSCVSRPFGITDQVVTTEFPSSLDDKYISRGGFDTIAGLEAPSYKFVAHHYFRLRLLQSEILQVLQHQRAQRARTFSKDAPNPFMHTQLPSPFLVKHKSFHDWRKDVDHRLWDWKQSAPTKDDTGVAFEPLFFELNYWQAVVMLYRQSLAAPVALHDGAGPPKGNISILGNPNVEEQGDGEFVFLKTAEAGQQVLRVYRQLHRLRLVNYTFLATQHLFMAGVSFLYAIWHSTAVRAHLSLDEVDFTVLAAVSVLDDLSEKCPPAEACRDALRRLSKATIQMCMSTTGFGPTITFAVDSPVERATKAPKHNPRYSSRSQAAVAPSSHRHPRPEPRFDMDLQDLFCEQEAPRSSTKVSHEATTQKDTIDSSSHSLTEHEEMLGGAGQIISSSLQRTPQQLPTSVPIRETFGNGGPSDESNSLTDVDVWGDMAENPDEPPDANMLDLFGIDAMQSTHDWSDGDGLDLFEGFFFGKTFAGNEPAL